MKRGCQTTRRQSKLMNGSSKYGILGFTEISRIAPVADPRNAMKARQNIRNDHTNKTKWFYRRL
jgi:hypothetical protein